LAELRTLVEKYAEGPLAGLRNFERYIDVLSPGKNVDELTARETALDDFAATGARSEEDIYDGFAHNFFFGCEADDPLVSVAFDRRLGPRLNAVFSSDISHFDVTNMADVLAEAFELRELELLTVDDFRDFTFSNAVRLHGKLNPEFFRGTLIEAPAKAELERQAAFATGVGERTTTGQLKE
jgi:hypothetical protein